MEAYTKKNNESYDDYCVRLYRNQELYGLKNDVIGFLINEAYPENKKDESAHRKNTRKYIKGFDDGYTKGLSDAEDVSMEGAGLDSLKPVSHLEKMTDMLGEYTIRKRDMQLERNSLSKLMREATPGILLTEKYAQLLEDGLVKLPVYNADMMNKSYNENDRHLKVITSDFHIGMVINEEYNVYNYDVTRRRLRAFADKALAKARLYDINNISIIDMGDLVESILLRGNQAWDCEFTESEQIVYAQSAYEEFIEYFTDAGYFVSVTFLRGNHDRLQSGKMDSLDTDSATFIIAENLKRLYGKLDDKLGHPCGVSFTQTNKYYLEFHEEINGKKIKYIHGDNTSANDRSKMSKYSGTDEVMYDYLILGHLHRFSVFQGNRNEFEIYCSSGMGGNEYGLHKIKSTSSAGATLLVFLEDGEVLIDNVNLQEI